MTDPLYRRSYEAAALLRDYPPQLRHGHKIALLALAYPAGVSPGGAIEVTRWRATAPTPAALANGFAATATIVRPDFYDYAPVNASADEWHVNFADPRLFVAYGSPLFAQDEMQVAEHPLLGSVREALLGEGLAAKTSDRDGVTPILIRGVERRLAIETRPTADCPGGLYGNRFAAAPWSAVERATRRIDPPTFTHLIAIAAPAGGSGAYAGSEIAAIFANACTGFAAAVAESAGAPTVVHTGFWGCGAFGGDRLLMIALQTLAARAAGVGTLVLHAGDPAGAADAQRGLDAANRVIARCGPSPSIATLIEACAALDRRWGLSDGN